MYQNICNFIDKEMTDLDHKIPSQGKLSMQEIQYADLLAHAKKSILTVEAMERSYNDGYSRDYNDNYERSYGARWRDSRGRYADGYSDDYQEYRSGKDMMGELHKLMKMAPNEEVKRKYGNFISEMEHMM